MDFVIGLPRTQIDCDAIWVIVDRVTKYAHFLAIHSTFSLDRLAKLYIDEIVKLLWSVSEYSVSSRSLVHISILAKTTESFGYYLVF